MLTTSLLARYIRNNSRGDNLIPMFKISVSPAKLSAAQRAYVADLIVNFPSYDSLDEGVASIAPFEVHEEENEESAEAVFTPATSVVETSTVLDSKGLPWDERIHGSSHAKNADGSWRRKRGVDDATVTEVEAQLRGVMSAPAVEVIAPAPPPPAAPAPPPPAVDPMTAYVQLIGHCSDLVVNGKLTQQQVADACARVGGPHTTLAVLQNRLDLVPKVREVIDASLSLLG